MDKPVRVTKGGRVRLSGKRWYLGDAWDQEIVGLRAAYHNTHEILFGPYLIGTINPLDPGRRVRLIRLGRSAPSLHDPHADEPHLSAMSPNGVSHVSDRYTEPRPVARSDAASWPVPPVPPAALLSELPREPNARKTTGFRMLSGTSGAFSDSKGVEAFAVSVG